MEINGVILSLTLLTVLIILGVALIDDRDHPGTRLRGPGAEPRPSHARALSRAVGYLSTSRQPVWPIGYKELENRVRRGLMVAVVMSSLASVISAANLGDAGAGLVWLVIGGITFSGIGCVMSAIHTLILRVLPYRGPIVSTALGALIGVAAGRALQDSSLPVPLIIVLGVVYGGIIGVIEHSVAHDTNEKAQNQPAG